MDKFGRNYKLVIGAASASSPEDPKQLTAITVRPPYTVEFDITRNTLSSSNVCQVRIYNLNRQHRDQIRFNFWNQAQYRPLVLQAGYGDNLKTIFNGNINQAWSVREGVNFITQIECFSGGFAYVNGVTSAAFPAGTAQSAVMRTLMNDLPFITPGAIGNYPTVSARGTSYDGNTTKILAELSNGGFYVDNGRAYVLGTNEYVADINGVTQIDASTGLLGTPLLERSIVRFDMIFEPGLNPGQQCNLNSITERNYNGTYKVTGVKHRGMISETVCGAVITTADFSFVKDPIGVPSIG